MLNKTELDTVFTEACYNSCQCDSPTIPDLRLRQLSRFMLLTWKHHILYAFKCIFREITLFASNTSRTHSSLISVFNLIPWQPHRLSGHSCGRDCKYSVCGQSKTQTRSKELYKGSPTGVTLHGCACKIKTTASTATAFSQHWSCFRLRNTWSKQKFPSRKIKAR